MRLNVLVLDYDGTIAQDGVLHPAVGAAIGDARAAGLTVVVATGRILSDLQRVMGDLRLVDAVVAENGAVVAFPCSGRAITLAAAPPTGFIDELRRRGLEPDPGQCVVELDAGCARVVLDVIRDRREPLTLIFNRERLMVLPQGVSKASGLREALRTLRLSEHNSIAVGDAENDHTLLATCELGVAVGWASQPLKAAADEVIEGGDPSAVAEYIRGLIASPRVPPERRTRRTLALGETQSGQPVRLGVRGRNVLVAGDPRSGKSWLAGLLCEQLIVLGYSVCVVDPEGDYRTLETLPGVITLGGAGPPPRPYEIAQAVRHADASVLIDLSGLPHPDKRAYVASLLPLLAALRRRSGFPHRIVIDEAHDFLPSLSAAGALDINLGGYTLVSYRPSLLPGLVREASGATIVTRTTDPDELGVLTQDGWDIDASGLSTGEAILLPDAEEAGGAPLRFRLAPRLTSHVRHRQKYLDVPLPYAQAFVFTRHGKPVGRPARTLIEFGEGLAAAPRDAVAGHLLRGDVSRWVAEVFGDHVLAMRIRELEQLQRLGHAFDEVDALRQLIDERYAPPESV